MSYQDKVDNYQYGQAQQFRIRQTQKKDYQKLQEPLLNISSQSTLKNEINLELEQIQGTFINMTDLIKKYEESIDRRGSSNKFNENQLDQQQQKQRNQITDLMNKLSFDIIQIKEKLGDFNNIQVETMKQKYQQQQEYNSFYEVLNEIIKKLEIVVKKFSSNEERNLEQARLTYLSRKKGSEEENDEEKQIDNQKRSTKKQKLVYEKIQIQEQSEVDQMEDLLINRKEQLNKVEKLMLDVHWVAKDIHTELHSQNEKLKRIDQNIVTTKDNVDLGNQELTQAKEKHLLKNKWLMGIFSCVAVIFAVILLSLLIKLIF